MIPYINVEAERLVTNVVNKVVNEEMKKINMSKSLVSGDSYNSAIINEIEGKIDKRIQDELIDIDDGIIEDYFIPQRVKKGRFKKIKNGILCDISIGSIRGSTLFANIGPTIPIKLLFSSGVNSNIDVDINEYGINNAIIKTYFNVEIREQITMPISSKRRKISIRKVIAVDIIKGKIPDYYTGLIN
ncbi:MAG: sporulation protein YunB [Bacilli bacterium]|nr:sporulation protein YunB [Bacilli bacterium]